MTPAKTFVTAAVLVALVMAVPVPTAAWGFEAHQFIADKAIALLPPELRPFFEANRAAFVERSIDPDTWQNAGYDSPESPHHQLDMDWEGYGPYPFLGLPRDFTAAVAKFGLRRIEGNGTLPWRADEMYGNLRRAFNGYVGQGPFGRNAIVHNAAWLTHYVSDGHQPLHAVMNYDGQAGNQRGIHTRFEAILFERYRDKWVIAPKALPPVTNARDFMFDALVSGTRLASRIDKADADAIGTRDVYDDRYYEAFRKSAGPVLEQRLNESIAAVAAMITGAWEAAGRPRVPVTVSEPVRRRRS
jgi:hypothetical protein